MDDTAWEGFVVYLICDPSEPDDKLVFGRWAGYLYVGMTWRSADKRCLEDVHDHPDLRDRTGLQWVVLDRYDSLEDMKVGERRWIAHFGRQITEEGPLFNKLPGSNYVPRDGCVIGGITSGKANGQRLFEEGRGIWGMSGEAMADARSHGGTTSGNRNVSSGRWKALCDSGIGGKVGGSIGGKLTGKANGRKNVEEKRGIFGMSEEAKELRNRKAGRSTWKKAIESGRRPEFWKRSNEIRWARQKAADWYGWTVG